MEKALTAFIVIGLILFILVSEGYVTMEEMETAGSWVWNRLKE